MDTISARLLSVVELACKGEGEGVVGAKPNSEDRVPLTDVGLSVMHWGQSGLASHSKRERLFALKQNGCRQGGALWGGGPLAMQLYHATAGDAQPKSHTTRLRFLPSVDHGLEGRLLEDCRESSSLKQHCSSFLPPSLRDIVCSLYNRPCIIADLEPVAP